MAFRCLWRRYSSSSVTERIRELENELQRLKTLKQDTTGSTTDEEKQSLPLEGIRVVDLSRILAGPFCTMSLADLGAEVIKIESLQGDDTRSWGPPFVNSQSTYFLSVNRNKKSITLNLRSPKAVEIIKKLTKISDVLVENFVPGTAESLGIDYERKALKQENPRLIYTSISGYGHSGPCAQRRGYDVMLSAMGGLMSITGEPNGPPVKVGVALTDVITGVWAQYAISAALYQRTFTNTGKLLQFSLLDTQVSSLVNVASAYLNAGLNGKRWGTAHASIVPYQAFSVKDGYLVVGANNDEQWHRFCHSLNKPELIEHPKFKTNKNRVENRVELIDIIQSQLIDNTKQHWEKVFSEAQLPVCPVNDMKEVFSDPQVLHNQIVQEIEHSSTGSLKFPGAPVFIDGERPQIRSAPPLLGEHSDEVLSNLLGYSEEQISQLRADGVI